MRHAILIMVYRDVSLAEVTDRWVNSNNICLSLSSSYIHLS